MFFNAALPAEMREFLTKRLDMRLTYVNSKLEGEDFLMGDQFTVADCYLFIVTGWADPLNYDLSPQENIIAWRGHIGDRGAVREVKATRPPE
jgi:glutathione S-transferase